MLTNSTILTINKCDTLRPLGILVLAPLLIVYVTLNTITGVLLCWKINAEIPMHTVLLGPV